MYSDHVAADALAFAATFFQKSPLIHSVAAPFRIEPAALGFDSVFITAPGIFFVNATHVGAKSALLRRFLCLRQKRRHPPAPLLLLSNRDPLCRRFPSCARTRFAFRAQLFLLPCRAAILFLLRLWRRAALSSWLRFSAVSGIVLMEICGLELPWKRLNSAGP